jgi:hypothetical protein
LYDFFSMRLKSIEIQPFGIAGFTIASKKWPLAGGATEPGHSRAVGW